MPILCALQAMLASTMLAADAAAPQPAAAPLQATAEKAAAQHVAAKNAVSLVLLRNGEVVSGNVTQEKERYVVATDGIEIRLTERDVDFVCRSLDEAYAKQRDRIGAGRVEDRLRLANWCLRHRLLGYAAAELATAMETHPRHPGVAVIDRRLQQALEQAAEPKRQSVQKPNPAGASAVATDSQNVESLKPVETVSSLLPDVSQPPQTIDPNSTKQPARPRLPVSSAELDRLSRNLPAGTVEQYIETVQPLLMNSCATVGCHGMASKTEYSLIRPANGRIAPRGMSQRNLFNTLQCLDHKRPGESELLVKAREPHGGKPVGALAEESVQYQQLVAWVRVATGAKTTPAANAPATVDLHSPGTRAQITSPFQTSPPAPYNNPPSESEPRKPIEKPIDEKPFYEQPASSEQSPSVESPKPSM